MFCFEQVEFHDLSYPLSDQTLQWPGDLPFKLCMDCSLSKDFGFDYAIGTLSCSEHIGTHVDAPYHFNHSGRTVDLLSVQELIGPCKVIDIQSQSQGSNRNYLLSKTDLLEFEHQYGELQSSEILLVRTGWHQKYALGAKEYYGYQEESFNPESSELNFPGIGEDAATYLVEKKVRAVGIDTPSLDCGQSSDFRAHRILLGNDIYGIENLGPAIANLPPTGCQLIVMPLKIVGGSGSPARVVAIVPKS